MSEVRDELKRNLEKQKLRQAPLSDDERGAAMAAQTLNAAFLGYGDDVSGAIDYLDDVIRLGKTNSKYADKVAHASALRQRLAQQEPGGSAISSAIGGVGVGGAVGGAIGGTLGGLGMAMSDPKYGMWKKSRDAYGNHPGSAGATPPPKGSSRRKQVE